MSVWETEPAAAMQGAAEWLTAGLTVRWVRGAKMLSTKALMSEVSAALQFPLYFGENWPALDECLADMDWLLPTKAIVLLVLEAHEVLSDEGEEELASFVSALASASGEYAEAIALGERWDRPPVPFHVVLQTPVATYATAVRRWRAAGALIDPVSGGR